MDISQSPAVLGGIMLWAALGAWALGRWQGGLVASTEGTAAPASPSARGGEALVAGACGTPDSALSAPRAAPEPVPCQNAARDERRVALDGAPCLGELHREITAYRRAEQVLARLDDTVLRLDPLPQTPARECRFIGLTGEPTCGVAGPVRVACAGGSPCGKAVPAPIAAWAVQPSPVVPGLTRV
jgi:hypothetical protein